MRRPFTDPSQVMPDVAPAVRTAYMKNLFTALGARQKLAPIAAAQPELVREVEAAPRLGWLPIERNVLTVETLAAVYGETRGLALLADSIYAQFETPLWKGLVGGAVRLLGRQPGSLGRWIPEAVRLVFRDCGEWTAERTGETELTVTGRALPPALASHALWLRCFAVGLTPLFTLCGESGTSRLAEASASARTARYLLHWKPRR